MSAPVPGPDLFPFMGISAVFPPLETDLSSPGCEINSIAFSDTGKHCACARDNGLIELYNTEVPKLENRFRMATGAANIQFTHHELSVLVSGTSPEGHGMVSYVSMYDCMVVREFKFHTERITSIAMSPSTDTFLTTSADGKFALWDLKLTDPVRVGSAAVPGSTAGNFDAVGVVVGIASPSGHVHLYSMESEALTSFASEHVSCLGLETKGVAWTDLRFSDDDRFIAMTSPHGIVLLDAFHLIDIALLRAHPYSHARHCNIAFSVDGTYLFTGGTDGCVYGYDLDGIVTGDALKAMPIRPRVNPKVHTLGDGLLQTGSMLPDGAVAPTAGLKHNAPVTAIAWHPKLAMLASGCTSLCFWTPPPV